jgi:hypothetical protein
MDLWNVHCNQPVENSPFLERYKIGEDDMTQRGQPSGTQSLDGYEIRMLNISQLRNGIDHPPLPAIRKFKLLAAPQRALPMAKIPIDTDMSIFRPNICVHDEQLGR